MHDLFLFGGMTEGEKCDDAGSTDTLSLGEEDSGVAASQCRKQAGVNNDLWWLDASTWVWKNVFENDASVAVGGTSPVGREGHSASKMGDGTIVVFGGKTLQSGDTMGTGKNLFMGRSSCSAGRPFRAGKQWEPGRTSSWETCGS